MNLETRLSSFGMDYIWEGSGRNLRLGKIFDGTEGDMFILYIGTKTDDDRLSKKKLVLIL